MNDLEYRHLIRLLDTTLLLIDRPRVEPEHLQRRLGAILVEIALLRARLNQPRPSTLRN